MPGGKEPDIRPTRCTLAGLSYSSFAYTALELSPAFSADPCADVVATVRVTNTGKHAAAEVAQLYLASPNATMPTPPLKLVGFDRTPRLAPGQSRLSRLGLCGARA